MTFKLFIFIDGEQRFYSSMCDTFYVGKGNGTEYRSVKLVYEDLQKLQKRLNKKVYIEVHFDGIECEEL